MAWMPENANLILNPTSGAPGFNVENVYSLPGVPSILKSMLGGLTNNIVGGEPIKSLSLIHISEPTRLRRISYAVFCLKKKLR